MTADRLKAKAHLYEPGPVVKWQDEQGRDGWFSESERRFVGENPPRGAVLFYALTQTAKSASLKVQDYAGKTVRELSAKTEPGLHQVVWDLTERPPRPKSPRAAPVAAEKQPAATSPEKEEEPPEEMPIFFGGRPKLVAPGVYRVVLTVDDVEMTQWLRVEADPSHPGAGATEGDKSH
jgi:hypothetical protein